MQTSFGATTAVNAGGDSSGNRLLDLLSLPVRQMVVSQCSFMDLPIRTPLFSRGVEPSHLYFLTGGLTSVVITMRDGMGAEVGMSGREGVVGAHALMGPSILDADCFMQVTGSGLRMPMSAARAMYREEPEFRDAVLRYVQEQLVVASQATACNRLHGAEQRLARWMLMVSDRIEADVLPLTQEFLAEMLGTQRSTMNLVAGRIQSSGAIEYRHGVIRILDRAKLAATACECYAVLRQALERLRS